LKKVRGEWGRWRHWREEGRNPSPNQWSPPTGVPRGWKHDLLHCSFLPRWCLALLIRNHLILCVMAVI
jgi:hypothetical protein